MPERGDSNGDNRWLGYSERGLVGAWLHDLHRQTNAPAALLEFLQTGGCPDPLAGALRGSHALTIVVEPGFAGFGNPDGLIVAEASEGPAPRATTAQPLDVRRAVLLGQPFAGSPAGGSWGWCGSGGSGRICSVSWRVRGLGRWRRRPR